MEETNVIKSIVESTCPHCDKPFYIESQFHPATIGGVFTKEKMKETKEDCIARVKVLALDEEKKDAVIKWIRDEATVFAPWETESIINSLLKPE